MTISVYRCDQILFTIRACEHIPTYAGVHVHKHIHRRLFRRAKTRPKTLGTINRFLTLLEKARELIQYYKGISSICKGIASILQRNYINFSYKCREWSMEEAADVWQAFPPTWTVKPCLYSQGRQSRCRHVRAVQGCRLPSLQAEYTPLPPDKCTCLAHGQQ